jgi:predicted 3-demethylubiquinone-9 3-methyltransferase (glyoxalase superfamily)
MPRQKVTPFLWYNDQAEDAAKFYVSLFPNSQIDRVHAGPGGKAFVVEFTLDGVSYLALNGGPQFQLTEAFSLSVDCADQGEIDHYWSALSEGGTNLQCGWLKDRYGLSWQVVPSILPKLMSNPARAGAVMQSLRQMVKLDIAGLQAAYDAAG